MFTTALSEFFDQQLSRLESAVGHEKVNEAMQILESEELDVSAIDRACCEELKLILCKKYDEPISSSTRLDKHGWSKAHVQDHMKRFLCEKIRRAGDLMRQTLGSDKASDSKNVEQDFDEVMASSLDELIK